jgi:hypothetical protein
MSEIKGYRTHRPIDPSDPGFEIPGHKLRWLSGAVSELNPGRIWQIIRKNDLNPDLLKHIVRHNPGAFSSGDTIRKGDLVLSYAPNDLVKEVRRELDVRASEAEGRITPSERNSKGDKVFESKVTTEATDLVQKFKQNNN